MAPSSIITDRSMGPIELTEGMGSNSLKISHKNITAFALVSLIMHSTGSQPPCHEDIHAASEAGRRRTGNETPRQEPVPT